MAFEAFEYKRYSFGCEQRTVELSQENPPFLHIHNIIIKIVMANEISVEKVVSLVSDPKKKLHLGTQDYFVPCIKSKNHVCNDFPAILVVFVRLKLQPLNL